MLVCAVAVSEQSALFPFQSHSCPDFIGLYYYTNFYSDFPGCAVTDTNDEKGLFGWIYFQDRT